MADKKFPLHGSSLSRRIAFGALVGLALSFFVTTPARADYFGPWYADDASHDYYMGTASSSQKSGFQGAMVMLDNTTDMYDTQRSLLLAGTDINFYAVKDSTGEEATFYAWASCTTAVSTTVCDRFHVVFNDHNPHPNYMSLACHEIGHTIGVMHQLGSNSSYSTSNRTCLRSNPDHTDYSDHDIAHINARY